MQPGAVQVPAHVSSPAPARSTGPLTLEERETFLEPPAAQISDRRVVTVLFTDVSGFTAMSEKLDPEEVTEIVNQFFAVLTEPIYRFGGVVDKYIGDAIMALFGAPIAHEDDPERAVWAAYEMQRAAKEFADKLEAKTGIGLKVRIGINTGLVVAGAVGGAQKQDYTVMGDTVNLAQRMEANARPGKVLVTGETFRQTRHRFSFTTLDPITVKGKAQPVEVYELEGPAEVSESPENRPFVGRERELGTLEAVWVDACLGRPQLVDLQGEAGIGKSRLLEQFLALARPRARDLKASCHSYAKGSSFGMVMSLLHPITRTDSRTSPAELRNALLSFCREVSPSAPERAAERLAFFRGLEPKDPDLLALSHEQRRNLAFNTLNRLLMDLAAESPLVLTIEDLQWADEASVQWLHSFLSCLADSQARVLVVVQRRPEQRFDSPHVTPLLLPLEPLPAEEGRALAASFLGSFSTELSAVSEMIDEVLDKAGGNPLFLRELLASLVDSGAIARSESGWQLSPAPVEGRMPSTIQGVIAARLDRFSSDARHLAQVAAVLGRSIPAGLLERVAAPRSGTLAALAEAGFLLPRGDGGYAFAQALFQEVAYQSLLMSRRKELHEQAGLAMQALYSERLDEHAHELAHHFLVAEKLDQGLPYLSMAAGRAFEFFDLGNAEKRIERAILLRREHATAAGPELAELLQTKGRIFMSLARFDEAHAALLEAFDVASDRLKPRVLEAQGDVFERQGNYREAMLVFQRGYELLQGESPAERASLLAKVGYAKFRTGATDESRALCLEAIDMLEGTGRDKDLGFAHSCVGLCYRRQGDTAKAIEHTRLALDYREKAGDLTGAATSCSNLANIYSDLGEMGQAEAYYHRSLKAYERVGDAYWIALCLNNLGSHLLTMGKLDEAEEGLRRALELQARLDAKFLRGLIGFNLGDVLAARGKPDDALESMQRALEVFKGIDAKGVFPEVCRRLAEVCVELGRFDEGEAYLGDAVHAAAELEDETTLGVVARVRSRMAALKGDRQDAERLASEAVALLEDQDAPLELGRALAWQSRLLGEGEASDAKRRAEEIFERIGARLDLERLSAVSTG